MSDLFAVAAESYDRWMGRYSVPLARALADLAGIGGEMRVLDVGAGPGALSAVLAARVGAERVAAVEPSQSFVAACRERLPGVDIRVAGAEALPFADGTFDAVLAQLVLNFVPDPEAGVAEMARVTCEGGLVAACVWDFAGGMTMLREFWDVAHVIDAERAAAVDERTAMRFGRDGEIAEVFERVGLRDVTSSALDVAAEYQSFDEFWAPFLEGVGPAGAFCAALDDAGRAAVREELERRIDVGDGPFELPARAWAAVGRR